MAKKKQVVVTVEELKLKIKHEKASHWLHSAPLFGVIGGQESVQFLTVDPIVDDKVLVIFALDPTDYTSERIFELIDLFRDRYQNLPWLPAIVFDQKYMFTKNPQFWDHYKKFSTFTTIPIYLDSYSEFKAWSKQEKFAKVFYYHQGQVAKEYTLDKDSKKTFLQMESDLQEIFRINDRGLPLPLLYEYELDSPVDAEKPSLTEVNYKGHWTTDKDSSTTDDHNAVLSIPFEGTSFRIIASLHTQARESTSRVVVTFNDKPIHQSCMTSSLIADNHGVTSFEVSRFQGIYDIFSSKEVVKGTLQLHFKNAANSPVIYWGSRIGN